jgi:hypothetical protein
MRLRVGLLLCLFAIILTIIAMIGCRKPLAPNIDRNKAPETWITAAPFDTITLVKGERPRIGTIPIRFHVYWAGSDRDGSVVGFYWAVVETIPEAAPGTTTRPGLPGPKADDYRYTTRTDSTFIFTVAEGIQDRQHAFFIYAVDDKGRPDPTPARFIFNADDRHPPIPVFEEDGAYATGRVYYFDENRVLQNRVQTFQIRDTLRSSSRAPGDTVPAGSRVTFKFHGEITLPSSVIKGFRYKLDESELQPTDPDSLFHGNLIEYGVPPAEADPSREGRDIQPVATGTKVFQLRVVDQANGSNDAYRRFQSNFSPDTWLAGPDPNVPVTLPWRTNVKGEKYALLVNGRVPAGGLPGTLLTRDSVDIMPVDRVPRRTFLEIYRDTVFIRGEVGTPEGQALGSTVHLGAWVVIHNGGFDRDSPYSVKVVEGIKDIMPTFPDGPVLRPGPQNGSPVGFRSLIINYLTPNETPSLTFESRLYPYFDPNDVLKFERIGAYHPMTRSGRSYSLQRAEDGDGARDGRVENPQQVVVNPRAGEESYRPLVLVFDVNFPPVLKTWDLSFRPRVSVVDTLRAPIWNLELPADDVDPFAGDPGGPSGGKTLRFRFKVTGLDTNGQFFEHYDPPRNGVQTTYRNVGSTINLIAPVALATGPATLNIELCDCSFCTPGEGRCINRDIPIYHVAQPPPAPTVTPSRPGLD